MFFPGRGCTPFAIIDAAGVHHPLKAPPKRFVVVGNAPFTPLHLAYLFPEAKDVLLVGGSAYSK